MTKIVQVFSTKQESDKRNALLKTEEGYSNRKDLLEQLDRIEKKKEGSF